MEIPFDELHWDDAAMAMNFQPTPASTNDTNSTPSPTSTHSLKRPRARSNENDSDSIAKFQVCSSCRRRKRKCSLDRPSCSLCLENGWSCEYQFRKKKPGPPKRSSNAAAITPRVVSTTIQNPVDTTVVDSLSPLPDINSCVKSKLIDLYFAHIQPMYPMFCRKWFDRNLAQGKIPNNLLYAQYALASRFASPEEFEPILGFPSTAATWARFARAAELEGQKQEDENACISLNDVKAYLLLTLYEFTRFPGRKAWTMAGSLARMAMGIGLDQIDSNVQNKNRTDLEMEELRFVWWAVWKLESAINTVTGSPFGIDSQSVGTALTSTPIASFTAGIVERSKLQFLPTDSSKSWKVIQELLTAETEDGLNMYFTAVCHLRTATICRQRLHANQTPDLIRHYKVLRNTLSCMRLSLPAWYFDPARRPALESSTSHRARLESLLLMYISQIQCYLPFSAGKVDDVIGDDSFTIWNMSVTCGMDIAAVLHHWQPEYFSVADPFIGSILWFASSMLTLHSMSVYGRSDDGPDVGISNALDLLNLAMEHFARYWPIFRLQLDAVHQLQSWTWLGIEFSELLALFAQLRIPMNPLKQEPGSIDIWQVVGTISQQQ